MMGMMERRSKRRSSENFRDLDGVLLDSRCVTLTLLCVWHD